MIPTTLAAQLRRYWPFIALLALTLLFFHRLGFSGLILARGDTFNYFYPYWAARNAALVQGQLPLWSPDLFMGVPLLANPQLGTFYPPNWLVMSPPDGIRISILLHVFWALLGAYALARHSRLNTLPALAAAAIFGLGGYTGAHVEQINQLQGVAWLPWLFLLFDRALAHPRRYVLLLVGALALQFLSGHTQTVFISGVGLGVFALVRAHHDAPLRGILSALLLLLLAVLLALPLIAPQLIPTLELTGVSNRSGGLTFNEVTSFSFNPLVAGRGLLPSYDGMLFGEFVAYGGIIGLGLALLAVLLPRDSVYSRARYVWVIIALLGLLLALGEFNPLYPLLARLPGFSFFRVPARWLALFALGMALLAGIGLQALLYPAFRLTRWRITVIVAIIALLAASTLLTPQEDVTGPAVPTPVTWIGWGVALVGIIFYLTKASTSLSIRREGEKKFSTVSLLTFGILAELFFASAILPYNTLAPPETHSGQRFTISQLLAEQGNQQPPGRLLSISGLLFDPGDKATLEARYHSLGMSDLGIRLGLVATKRKEIIAPNLPLVWGIPSIDGFDGGLLPTARYSAFSSLLLNDDPTTDGRLFETLAQERCRGACIPDQRWLNLTNTRYLVTDKVYDLWHEDVAYDTQFSATLASGDRLTLENPTGFESNAVDLLFSGGVPTLAVNDETLTTESEGELDAFRLSRWLMDDPTITETIEITAEDSTTVHAVTLVDTRTGDFAQFTLPPWRRLLSSDIKLYKNQAVLPRAFVVQDILNVPDTPEGTTQALDLMRDSDFDPAVSVVIHTVENPSPALPVNREGEEQAQSSSSPAGGGGVEQSETEGVKLSGVGAIITHYSPTRIELTVDSEADGYLILTDAHYPGWRATVNGSDTPVLRANIMFRAVAVPAGRSEVIFSYEPAWLPGALILGAVAWLVWLAGVAWLWLKSNQSS